MMFLNELMKEKNMTRAELSRKSGVPESTLRDILSGKAQFDRCEVLTVACIAGALDTTIEELLGSHIDEALCGGDAARRQPFKPGEVTPEEANRIGYELASRLLGGEHAFLVATHTDWHHIHNHIVFCATTLDCKRK